MHGGWLAGGSVNGLLRGAASKPTVGGPSGGEAVVWATILFLRGESADDEIEIGLWTMRRCRKRRRREREGEGEEEGREDGCRCRCRCKLRGAGGRSESGQLLWRCPRASQMLAQQSKACILRVVLARQSRGKAGLGWGKDQEHAKSVKTQGSSRQSVTVSQTCCAELIYGTCGRWPLSHSPLNAFVRPDRRW